MTVDTAFSSRASAATVVGVALTFWLSYFTFATGTPLVNPLWATMFGVVPALVSSVSSSSVTFLVALVWPVTATLLVGTILMTAGSRVNRAAHILIWVSLLAIAPTAFAETSNVYRSVTVYRFVSM